MRRIELEARQLQHIQLRHRLIEQFERRTAEVAAGEHALARGLRHPRHERRHRALAIRAGNRRDERTRFARKQFDVADDGHAARSRTRKKRFAQRHAGRRHDLGRAIEQSHVETAKGDLRLRRKLTQRRSFRRRGAAVRHRELHTARTQVTRARHARAPEADDDGASGLRPAGCADVDLRRHAQRTFRVARPTSTRITEMIQKRTITFGSAQPLSSK